MKSNKEKLLSNYKNRITDSKFNELEASVKDPQVAVLLGELQIAQLELEMQNDELSMTSDMLEVERSKFAGFFDLAPIGYFILDQIGLVLEVNQVGLELLAVARKKILHQRFQSFIFPEELDRFYNFIHQLLPGHPKQSIETQIRQLDGRGIYAKLEGIAIPNSFTNQISYYVTVTDITSNKLAQRILQETTERLELALNASGTGIWSLDLETGLMQLDDFSLSLLDLYGWEYDGTLKRFLEVVHPDDQNMVREQISKLNNDLSKIDFEFKVLAKNNSIKHLAIKGKQSPIKTSQVHYLGVIIDITAVKTIALARQELKDEKQKLITEATFKAQEAERYRFSSVLHDSICQLLYGIKFKLQNFQLNGSSKSEYKAIEDLLSQAIKETRELSYELTPSVLRDFGFVEGVRDMANRLSSRNFKVTSKIKPSANLIDKDIQLTMFRIIQELINNCIKHANASKADILVCSENGSITILVTDNGNGFKQDLDTALANGSGLRNIKNRISLLGGTLNISVNKGTTVTVNFKYN